ncbi:MAG: GDSL-type esterase/lipase family protein [Pseudomonadota bacterium]
MTFGDSNTFRAERGDTTWTVHLESKAPGRITVFNEGCNGRTTQYDSGERNGLSIIEDKLIAHAPVDYVIVMLGTNDVKSMYGPPSAAKIADGMRKIFDVIDTQGGGAQPILVTPPPLGKVTSGDLADAQWRIPPVAAQYRLLAMGRNIQLVDLNAVIDSSTDIEHDKVHLNATGRQKVADAVWAILQNLIVSSTAPVLARGSRTCVPQNIIL